MLHAKRSWQWHAAALAPAQQQLLRPLRCAAGGKLLALCGGFHKAAEVDTRELAVLSLDTLAWDRPGSGRLAAPLKEHCALAVGRTKVRAAGGPAAGGCRAPGSSCS